MPFDQLIPRPFTCGAVRMYAPVAAGVYGISNALEWIYIGATDDIRGTLLEHLRERDTALMKRQPSGFVFELCVGVRQAARQGHLVTEYGPTCNRYSSPHS
jgi:hypothetical protein